MFVITGSRGSNTFLLIQYISQHASPVKDISRLVFTGEDLKTTVLLTRYIAGSTVLRSVQASQNDLTLNKSYFGLENQERISKYSEPVVRNFACKDGFNHGAELLLRTSYPG